MPLANFAAAPFTTPNLSTFQPASSLMNPRLILVVATVVCAHGLALWALQAGLQRPTTQITEPVVMMATLVAQPEPEVAPLPTPPSPPDPKPRAIPKQVVQARQKPVATPVPVLLPTPMVEVAPAHEMAVSEPAASPSVEPVVLQAAPAAPPAPPAPPAPAKVELPSSNASYLNNAPPRYPSLSKRLGEQGQVVIRALIETNGTASQASIKKSSGYDRLDQTALQTVQTWRYVPGKRAGLPAPMWFNIPVNFVLE